MATVYNALAQEKLLSREHMELVRVSQGGFDSDVVLGARVADTAGCSTSVASRTRTRGRSATAGQAAHSHSSTSNTASATRTS
jgi:hypothetical protein